MLVRIRATSALSSTQRAFNRAYELRAIRCHPWVEAGDDFAIATNQELLEVPEDVALILRTVPCEIAVHRVTTLAVHVDLRRQWKRHVVLRRAEILFFCSFQRALPPAPYSLDVK